MARDAASPQGAVGAGSPARVEAVVVGELRENCYLMDDGAGGVVVVDPGDEWPLIEGAIGGRPVSAVLVTHFHADHVGALGALVEATGAPWYIGQADAPMLAPGRARSAHPRYPAVEVRVPPTGALRGRDVVEAGLRRFEVIDCPGHSKGGVTYFERRAGVAFTGDTLFAGSCGRTDLTGGSGRAMADSLARLAKLPEATLVLPGHGPRSTIGAERAGNPYMAQSMRPAGR